jgi:hypothetical protein
MVKRQLLDTAENESEAWDLAGDYAGILRHLGLIPSGWRIGVRRVRGVYFVEAVSHGEPKTARVAAREAARVCPVLQATETDGIAVPSRSHRTGGKSH